MREKYLGFKAVIYIYIYALLCVCMCCVYIYIYTHTHNSIYVYIPVRLIKAKEVCIYWVQGARWEKVKQRICAMRAHHYE